MTWLARLLATRAGRCAAAALLLIGALLGLRARWRAEGRADAERKAQENDHARAIEIHRQAAEARAASRPGDPVEQLRKAGRLRD